MKAAKVESRIEEMPEQPGGNLDADQVFQFLRNCDEDTYKQMEEKWQKEGGDQGFSQA